MSFIYCPPSMNISTIISFKTETSQALFHGDTTFVCCTSFSLPVSMPAKSSSIFACTGFNTTALYAPSTKRLGSILPLAYFENDTVTCASTIFLHMLFVTLRTSFFFALKPEHSPCAPHILFFSNN